MLGIRFKKITSNDFYRRFRENITDHMKSKGFKRTKGGRLGWYEPVVTGFFTVWFQCDKWGWDDDWGSRFTVEFQKYKSSDIGIGLMAKRQRLPSLLNREDLEVMRTRNNAIISAMPGFLSGRQVYKEVDRKRVLILGKVLSEEPYDPAFDPWFEYFTYQDIDSWSDFLVERLVKVENQFLEVA